MRVSGVYIDDMRPKGKKPAAAGSEGGASAAASAPKKPPAAAAVAAAAAAAKPAKGGAAPGPGALDSVKFKHTPEDAEALAAEVIPAKYATELGDANWKTRLAALEDMTGWMEGAAAELDSEVVVRFLAKRGWNEKNFQVCDTSIASGLYSMPFGPPYRSQPSCTVFFKFSRISVLPSAELLSLSACLISVRS